MINNCLHKKSLPVYGNGKNIRDWLYVADHCQADDDISKDLITYVEDRKGHDWRYAIDSSLLKKELSWQPNIKFKDGIELTINWYLDNLNWMKEITSGEYKNYYQKFYGNRKLINGE